MNSTTDFNETTLDFINNERVARLTPSIVYVITLLLVGTPGNTIVLFVYYKRWRKSSTRVFILALAVLDLINCVFSLPMEIANMFLYFKFDYGWLCKLSRFLTYFCNSAGALVLIAIAVDRYQRICRPHGSNMTTKTAKIVCTVVFIVSLSTTWPSLIIYGTQFIPLTKTVTAKICLIENAYVTTIYPLAYFLFMCTCTFINFITLSVLYSLVGARVCRRSRFLATSIRTNESFVPDEEYYDDEAYSRTKQQNTDQKSLQNGSESPSNRSNLKLVIINAATTLRKTKETMSERRMKRIGKTTLMLFIVTIVYVLSFIPFLGLVIHRSIFPSHFRNLTPGGETIFQLFLRSYLLNCAVNPIIYSFCSDLFRKECCSLLLQVVRLKRSR